MCASGNVVKHYIAATNSKAINEIYIIVNFIIIAKVGHSSVVEDKLQGVCKNFGQITSFINPLTYYSSGALTNEQFMKQLK
jgi:hypothetical protein